MIRREYSTIERRAVNQVYNGAERYDFEPLFLASTPEGEPDLYLNILIGLSVKWLGYEPVRDYFQSFVHMAGSEDLDTISWLGLENYLYEKELPQRPILSSLRRKYAADFYHWRENMSRQQMMAVNVRVVEQQEYRWSQVIGKRSPLLSRTAAALARELCLPPELSAAEVLERLKRILGVYFHVHISKEGEISSSRRVNVSAWLKKIMYRETRETDSLLIRQSGIAPDSSVKTRTLQRGQRLSVQTQEDEKYIRAIFGHPLYPDHEMKLLENELCRGNHEKCRLYIAGARPEIDLGNSTADFSQTGRNKEDETFSREVKKVRQAIEAQAERNRKYSEKSGELISSSIRSLSASLDTLLATYAEPLPEKSPKGKLDPSLCYRLPLFQDPMVFKRPGDEMEHHIKIDLLLDASASRVQVQEIISAQTRVIVQSLQNCGIPCRVMSFRSLRGFTVLQRLKDYDQKVSSGLDYYYASGWNRDGLALLTCARLIRESDAAEGENEHILIILTDASPDDSTHMPSSGKFGLEREYEGGPAVTDTADAVKNLRRQGIHTVALYLGSTAHVENANLIYGSGYVTVRNIETLAARVETLLQTTLTEMKN